MWTIKRQNRLVDEREKTKVKYLNTKQKFNRIT